ncbi:neprilysin-2-like isoform X2 [Stegodyphus dumicola]|uniref:neprilysin-2-like isoform X2 n=1 Tax=Stegodyphus dumicola TaxID=202533 RepID=UPI0015B35355|nr:neprilysin-2-like isoform X2 [Stegodyphus dumicola]
MPNNVSSISELCLTSRCITEASEQTTEISVDLEKLASFLNTSSEYDFCLTLGCAKAAVEILSNLNESVDPCDDFYEFACGGWIKEHGKDKSCTSVLSNIQHDIDLKLKNLLENELTKEEPVFIRMIRDMYFSCMNEIRIKAEGTKPIKDVLRYLGGWPMVAGRKWESTTFDWLDTLIKIRDLGFSHDILMELSVTVDPWNNGAHVIKLGKPLLGIDGRHLLHGIADNSTNAYLNLMVQAAQLLGAKGSLTKKTYKTLEFEMMLANLSSFKKDGHIKNKSPKKFRVKKLMAEVKEIKWLKYLRSLLNDQISIYDIVLVEDIDFFKNLATFIKETDKRVIANYMLWRVVYQSLSLFREEWRNLKHTTRNIRRRPRWKECITEIRDNLGIALSSYYVRNYFIEDNKESINGIMSHIGYPKELLNDSYVSDLYKNLNFKKENYFNNTLKMLKWSTDYSFSLLQKRHVKGEWKKYSKSTVVKAFYDHRENSIDIPAGILQHPIFNINRPHYLNFGSIGYFIGYQIAHALNRKGQSFNKNGIRKHWFGKSANAVYKNKTQCIVDQYDNYIVENGMQVNGLKTKEKNIADVTGLKAAYQAYQSWIKDNGKEPKLPGLVYTPNQLFWISAANVWCEKLSPKALEHILTYKRHSPSKFRVIGPMSNLAQFAKDFNCKADSLMVRRNSCEIW